MSDRGREGFELIRRMCAKRMKMRLVESGFLAEHIEIKTKDGLEAGLVCNEILDALAATYPNATVRRLTVGTADADFILTTVDGLEYAVRIKHDGQVESEERSEMTKTVSAQPKTSRPRPPVNAEFILHLLLKREEQDAVIGDLLERYVKKHKRLGKRRADIWFYMEVARSLWPLAKRSGAKAIKIAVVGEWIRRMIH
jgi:hypothetical protein